MRAPPAPQRTAASIGDLPKLTADLLHALRARRPRVHCITNSVAQAFTANMLLAIGALPSMTISPEEISPFVARADALLVNLGTFDAERRETVGLGLVAATEKKLPWVLDPVLIDRSPPRAEFARRLVQQHPRAIRLNAGEFAALAQSEPQRTAVKKYAAENRSVIGLTGETDIITDGVREVEIANGHPFMARVTAMGCAGSALVGAFVAVETDPLRATAAALLTLGVAGEIAAESAKGPGSFAASIIDALHNIDGEALLKRARVS
jgi:hydroxyethylthiazole kinase